MNVIKKIIYRTDIRIIEMLILACKECIFIKFQSSAFSAVKETQRARGKIDRLQILVRRTE